MTADIIKLLILYLQNRDKMTKVEREIIWNTLKLILKDPTKIKL